jgi:hypothetical protein
MWITLLGSYSKEQNCIETAEMEFLKAIVGCRTDHFRIQTIRGCKTFEVFVVMKIPVIVFWDVTLCGDVVECCILPNHYMVSQPRRL